jgi:hypothetical protein
MVTRCTPGLLAALLTVSLAHAQPCPAPDWSLLAGPGTSSVRLWTRADGSIVAADANEALWSSQDAGDSWQLVPAPQDGWAVAPDPVDARIVYGAASDGLYKSADAGASWQVIRPSSELAGDPSQLGSAAEAACP